MGFEGDRKNGTLDEVGMFADEIDSNWRDNGEGTLCVMQRGSE